MKYGLSRIPCSREGYGIPWVLIRCITSEREQVAFIAGFIVGLTLRLTVDAIDISHTFNLDDIFVVVIDGPQASLNVALSLTICVFSVFLSSGSTMRSVFCPCVCNDLWSSFGFHFLFCWRSSVCLCLSVHFGSFYNYL